MLRIKMDDNEYSIRFQYSRHSNGKRNRCRTTKCFLELITRNKDGSLKFNPISEAEVRNCSMDQFVKRVGRLRALEKLLKEMNVSREFRSTVWNSYFQKSPFGRHIVQAEK